MANPSSIFAEFGEGRCISCGLLGLIAGTYTPGTVEAVGRSDCNEAASHHRASGDFSVPSPDPVTHAQTYGFPACFVGKANFMEEIRPGRQTVQPTDARADKAETFQSLTRNRRCDQWILWRQFVSPKEHWEQREMKRLEDSRRRFDLFLFIVSVSVAVLAFATAIASVPKNSFVLCDLHIPSSDCSVVNPPPTPSTGGSPP